MITRRTFIGSVAALAALDVGLKAQAVPNSAGTEHPKLAAPSGACDCHHHIYDLGRFKPVREGSGFQPNGRVDEFRLLQCRLGTTRDVIVTPLPVAWRSEVRRVGSECCGWVR